ncbi:thiamine pyrophosphate-binding protein [Natronobacterium gregoryi]|uniref:Thiamine pyrophosphate protein central region n=2 Tax=Natronobacterium gregoryi TaxID=44930 RepID=L0AGC8_NATGS|nr:thiamine pyrophosphate-binding protein [Natronobacterium gregoryi]AFZ72474.1 thiamine pyrophosphate-dependent enzyme, possible carboligase or decarboxylase [Natronobacterium gregoryi SP2]ELY74344.1 thiamine pyrophosphate protein central region [Natronobacterium gregoryi SP2]PLK21445.1 thiamine pyrophosphate-binding protein [Natronobacterium gregoryi SP2]SFI77626.1 acetolactate synthase-1/2/3 large subunit [Natronobacterium gregoryi]
MTTASELVETLEALDIEYVFGYPGGRVIELLESLPDSEVEFVRPRDEREASVMAEMHGRLTGTPGVLAGQGPWIGSLGMIGQMEARLASSPMVVLTEASERGEYSTLAPYQQARGDYGGFSLPDILDGVTKEWWFPRTPTETLRSVQLAFKHAVAGRPGPTAVILDGDAIAEDVPDDPTPSTWDAAEQTRTWDAAPTAEDVAAAVEALEDAERPVIVAGNGVHVAGAYDELAAVAETYDCAVTTSYLGKSTFPETDERAAGVIGSFGHEGANRVVSEADALLVVGCRLNPMDTNWQAPEFIRPDEQTIVHADVDTRNAGWVYPADVGLIGDAKESLAALAEAGSGENGWARPRAAEAREWFTAPECEDDSSPIKPQRAVAEIESVVDEETIVTADSGNNRFWLLYYLQTPAVGTYFGSGGVGGMGWSTPAAVSAALTTENDVVGVAGDGGFAMTMNSVETAVEYGVAPTFVVLNDTSLGMVRQMQDEAGDIAGVEFHDTDFVAAAEAFGAVGRRVTTPDELADALESGKAADVPHVVDVRIDREEGMAETLSSSFYDSVGGLHE